VRKSSAQSGLIGYKYENNTNNSCGDLLDRRRPDRPALLRVGRYGDERKCSNRKEHYPMSAWPSVYDEAWVDHAMSVIAKAATIAPEPVEASPGLYVAKNSGRRCTVVWVANWNLGVKYREDGETYTRTIREFLSLYERV
jgi:hypothetical protein